MQVIHPLKSISGTSDVTVIERGASDRRTAKEKVDIHYIVLYLTLNVGEDCNDEEDIIYQFPRDSTSDEIKQLLAVRGACMTATDVMRSITGSSLSITALFLGKELLNVGCLQFDKEILLVALPAKLTTSEQMKHLLQRIEHVLVFLYGSVTRAFSSPEHKEELDYLSSALTSGGSDHIQCLSSDLLVTPSLNISGTLKEQVSSNLSNMNSSVYRDPSLECLGSALYYKEYLVYSCLPGNCCSLVNNYLNLSQLLCQASRGSLKLTIVWREVCIISNGEYTVENKHYHHSNKQQQQQQQQHEQHCCHALQGQSKQRTFLLVVGLKSGLLCALLRSLHLGEKDVPPNALMVDMGKSLLLRLNEEGVFTSCQMCLQSMQLPTPSSLGEGSPPLPGRKWSSNQRNTSSTEERSDSLWPAEGEGTDGDLQSCHNVPFVGDIDAECLSGCLLHYVHFDKAQGVVVAPLAAVEPHSLEDVKNFAKTCHQIRKVLHQGSSDKKPSIEHGVLFESVSEVADKKGKMVPLRRRYWIIGHRFPDRNTEAYVSIVDTAMNSRVLDFLFSLKFKVT
jgi:hypothetical protein